MIQESFVLLFEYNTLINGEDLNMVGVTTLTLTTPDRT